MAKVEWGPRIPIVHGRPPAGISGETMIRAYGEWQEFVPPRRFLAHGWNEETVAIRLPEDHPHYAQQTPTPDVVGIAPELVERMVAHFRAVVAKYGDVKDGHDTKNADLSEARAIVALLPELVDGDIEEAEAIMFGRGWDRDDEHFAATRNIALDSLKRGRVLERGEA